MGRLSAALSGRYYFDANCFIYTLEQVPPFHQELARMWDAAYAGRLRIMTSELTLAETLVGPLQTGKLELAADMRGLLESPDIDLIPIERATLLRAAELRAGLGLHTPDAIHAATALRSGCTALVTNDKAPRRIPDISVIYLSEVV